MKTCIQCKISKPLSEFRKNKYIKDGHRSECRECSVKNDHTWTTSLKGKLRSRKHHLKRTYGITPEEFEAMYERQKGLCAICLKPMLTARGTCIDHDHVTGQVRGLLCAIHNTGLGMFQDNIELLQSAIQYLQKYSQKIS